jgi:hypothetical protein
MRFLLGILLSTSIYAESKMYCFRDTYACGITAMTNRGEVLIAPRDYALHIAEHLKIRHRPISIDDWERYRHYYNDLKIIWIDIPFEYSE